MFHVVLVHPEIPPNTGNAIRLCANTGCSLHLIEPLGFSVDDKHLIRAGLDYHEFTTMKTYPSWEAFLETEKPSASRMFAMTTKGSSIFSTMKFQPGDWLIFGSEGLGLPDAIRESFPSSQRIRLPMVLLAATAVTVLLLLSTPSILGVLLKTCLASVLL